MLPLRDAAAVAEVRRQVDGLDETLLLSLPALAEVEIRVDGAQRQFSQVEVAGRWQQAQGSGPIAPELLAGLAAEDRHGDGWRARWAIPVSAGRPTSLPTGTARVVRAPTPTDDPLTIPAVLVASYPLDATRRRVVPGPLADLVTERAAEVLVTALGDLPPDPALLALVPTGLPDGAIDAGLHAAVLAELRLRPWLPTAADPDVRVRPADAVSVADGLVAVLADVVPSLLPAGWTHPALVTLGVHRPSVAELVAAVAAVRREPRWWGELYAALDAVVPAGNARDALGALPVPLVDGSMVTGPRGVTLPVPGTAASDLSALGLRVVDPAAAHPLLASLGAAEGSARGLLEQPRVRAAVEESFDAEDPEPIANAVLALVAAVGPAVGELPWLAELALPDETGEWRPAGELLLPDGPMAAVVAGDSPFGRVGADWVRRWGAATLAATGVLDGPAVVREPDAVGPDHDLDGEVDWWQSLPDGAAVAELVAVRDLELIAADRWADGLAMLARPEIRPAIIEPAVVLLPDGGAPAGAVVHRVVAAAPCRHRRPASLAVAVCRRRPASRTAVRRGPGRGGSGAVAGDRRARRDATTPIRTTSSSGLPTRLGSSPGGSCGRGTAGWRGPAWALRRHGSAGSGPVRWSWSMPPTPSWWMLRICCHCWEIWRSCRSRRAPRRASPSGSTCRSRVSWRTSRSSRRAWPTTVPSCTIRSWSAT